MKTENTDGKINQLLAEQFAIDYGCSVSDFCCKETLVTELHPNEQARKREEPGILSMLSCRGKLVIAAVPELMDWSRSYSNILRVNDKKVRLLNFGLSNR